MTTQIKGAESELRVSADLMEKGYTVYRALDSSAAFDLIAVKVGILMPIEVKTARYNRVSNGLQWSMRSGQLGKTKVLALVAPNGTITYKWRKADRWHTIDEPLLAYD